MKINEFDSSFPPPDNGRGRWRTYAAGRERTDRVEISLEARTRLRHNNGRTAANRLDLRSILSACTGYVHQNASGVERIELSADMNRARKIEAIQKRVAAGYYESSAHLENLADILIDKLNLRKTDN